VDFPLEILTQCLQKGIIKEKKKKSKKSVVFFKKILYNCICYR